MTKDTVQLIAAHLDHTIDPDDADTLAERIATSDDAADAVAAMMMLDLHLHDQYQSRQQAREATRQLRHQRHLSTSSMRRRWMLPAGVAVAAGVLIVFISVGLYFNADTPQAAPVAPNRPAVAMLTNLEQAEFGQTAGPMQLGQDLAAGPVTLNAGRAQMMLKSGAVVDLIGPCTVEMIDQNAVKLTRGALLADVPEQAVGFTVHTPRGLSIVDLGTRFYAEVTERGTQIETREGAVQIVREGQPVATLNAGESRYITEIDIPPLVIDETFDDGALDTALTWVDSKRWQIESGIAHYVGPDDSRSYLRSTRGDLLNHDFDFEAAVSVVYDPTVTTNDAIEPISNRIYLGLGDAVPSNFFEEIRLGGSMTIVTDNGQIVWQYNKPSIDQPAVPELKPVQKEPAYGDYRLRMIKRDMRIHYEVRHGDRVEHYGPIDLTRDEIPFDPNQTHAYLGLGRFGVHSSINHVKLTIYPSR